MPRLSRLLASAVRTGTRSAFRLRGSAEVVGTALLTFGVSRFLPLAGRLPFSSIPFGLVVLALYLLFVPYDKVSEKQQEQSELTPRLSR